MKNVRLGIVGLGNIGRFHTGYLLENKVSRCTLAAVSDAFAPSLESFKGKPGLKTYADASEMIRSGRSTRSSSPPRTSCTPRSASRP